MNKEEKSEYNKKYNEANKEILAAKRKVYKQTYNKANKEKVDTYNKAWREANKEYFKAWNEANKEKISAYKESKKDGLYTVYYLKEEHYAGMTSRLYYRLAEHKSKYNRHIEDVEIIGKYKTKKEATRVEAALHAMGYLGGHPRTKQQTLKQVL
tara:strand:+ start:310 stop:771 length:462 start_codon:yes stop_codon:yes gene_type:complete